MAMVTPKKAVCKFDLRPEVLCCSCCGACGGHAHPCTPGSGMVDPVVASCGLAGCRFAGGLVCSVCGLCGKHPHNHGAQDAARPRAKRAATTRARKPPAARARRRQVN